jgi:signal transduction histidine kinase
VAQLSVATDAFIPRETRGAPEELRRARLAVALSWVTAAFFLVAALGQAMAGNSRAIAFDLALGGIIFLGPFVGRRTGLKPVAHGILAVVFAALVAMAILVRGAGLTGATLVLVLLPLWATLLVGVRAGAAWTGASLVAGLVIGWLGEARRIADQLPADKRLINDHAALAIGTIVVFAVALLYERQKEAALRSVHQLEEGKRLAELEHVRALNDVALARSERLASLGRIAAATAHEINNPLTYVSINLQTLSDGKRLPQDDDTKLLMRQALDGVARIQQIVSDMLLCARPGDDQVSSADLPASVAMAVKMAEPSTRTRAPVKIELGELPRVVGSESRLVRVFLNLLVNAAQAIPEGKFHDHHIEIGARVEGDCVLCEVRDDGRGIPSDIIDRVKEPFFTTKGVGEGTGLGLTLCEGIVRSFGGTLTLESAPGRTVVTIALPLAEAPPPAKPLPSAPTAAVGNGPARVLIVDDEEEVARAVARLLPADAVTLAHSGREALALFDAGRRFDLILCDVMMPDLTGMDLFERLRVSDRDAADAMVFMTVGTFTDRAQAFRASVSNLFLDKPIALTTLRALVAAHAPPSKA